MTPSRVFESHGRTDFARVAGILRLSTKYLLDSIRANALAHLRTAWPTTLKDWDIREERARAYEAESSLHGGLFYPSPVVSASMFVYTVTDPTWRRKSSTLPETLGHLNSFLLRSMILRDINTLRSLKPLMTTPYTRQNPGLTHPQSSLRQTCASSRSARRRFSRPS
jgi:hypothetical protein